MFYIYLVYVEHAFIYIEHAQKCMFYVYLTNKREILCVHPSEDYVTHATLALCRYIILAFSKCFRTGFCAF